MEGTNLRQTGQNWAQNQVFYHFLKFDLLVSLEIAQDDSLKQCLTTSRGKIHYKNFRGPNLDQTGKIRPKIRFFVIFSSFIYQFSFKLQRMKAWNNSQLLMVKTNQTGKTETNKQTKMEVQNWSRNQGFCHFIKFAS